MLPLDVLTGSWLGSLAGMRHALEPDHVAAVTTLLSRERSGARAIMLGVFWGLGHTAALVAVAVAVMLMRAQLPSGAVELLEFGVAIMLVGLGVRSLLHAARLGPEGPAHLHRHGRIIHRHTGVSSHLHVGGWTLARRPLLIGTIHGLAGSGALTALVLTTLPSPTTQLAYVILFGVGSTLGMAVLSGLLGWPLARFGHHHAVARSISFLVGIVSTVIGLAWGYPIAARLIG
jgi:hypothetical protein